MGIFDYALIGLFLLSFVGSCASLGAAPPPALEREAP